MANEFNTIIENSLGALASGRTAAKVRAVDDQGQSVNLTPAQLATMAGIDYTKEVEQIVPGVLWFGFDGTRKQVYVKTSKGKSTGSDKMKIFSDIYNASTVFHTYGFYETAVNDAMPLPNPLVRSADGAVVFYVATESTSNFNYTYTTLFTKR